MKYLTLLTFVYIPLYLVYYLIKRPIFMLLYPIAYIFRKQITKNVRTKYDYKEWDKTKQYNWKEKPPLIWYLLWLILDDPTYFEPHGDGEYFDEYLPGWLYEKQGKFWEFVKAYYWGALRNNAVNLSRVIAVKGFIDRYVHIGGKYNFIEVKGFKGFPYYVSYFQFYIPFTKDIRVKVGWLTNGSLRQV